jgi:hypothetical protein
MSFSRAKSLNLVYYKIVYRLRSYREWLLGLKVVLVLIICLDILSN